MTMFGKQEAARMKSPVMTDRFRGSPPALLNIGLPGLIFLVCLALLVLNAPVKALPEYASRTGETCGTCHISPGGAGPLTLRGLAWIANDRPDKVPSFENVLLAPGLNDAAALYEVACSACHGLRGEGLSGSRLAGFDFSKSLVRRAISKGVPDYHMPSFAGQFTDEQLAALTAYVSDLSGGRVVPQDSYPIPSGHLTCASDSTQSRCGGN
jgi:Cytochrome C oxidase, cbb3-type, subunit III